MLTPEFWRSVHDSGRVICAPTDEMRVHNRIIDYIRDHAPATLKNFHLLDAGASPVLTMPALLLSAHANRSIKEALPKLKITAVDILPQTRDIPGVTYHQASILNLPLENRSQHGALINSVLEYFEDKDKERALRQVKNTLKKDGALFLVLQANDNLPFREKIIKEHEYFVKIRDYFEGKATKEDALEAVKKVRAPAFEKLTPEYLLRQYETANRDSIERRASEEGLNISLQMFDAAAKGRFKSMVEVKQMLAKTGFEYLTHENMEQGLHTYWFVTARRKT